jgi:hypothetical protein
MSARVAFTIPIRTKNPLNLSTGNTRLAAIIRTRQRHMHRDAARACTLAAMRTIGLTAEQLVPCIVDLIRVSSGKMDGDGLQASFKGIRDGIADALCVNDGGPFVVWRYGTKRCPQKHHCVEVVIARAA